MKMGQALYRKYRSKSLAELVGQEHITTTLGNALKGGKISHAYLFTGPRGVGKTSVARILAHEVNDLIYEEESNHLDIIEIDAASNRGIEEIRELRQKVHTAPAHAKLKVYIIDEAHMLTKPAFNALLKTLEEPPAHVIFILATTEAYKLPETIISRTQRFDFKPIELEKVISHLRHIAKEEGINVTAEALELIAQHGGGSFRDSISLLDQASSSAKDINKESILAMLGIPPSEVIDQLIQTMLYGNPGNLLQQLRGFREQGYHIGGIAKQLGEELRNRLIANQLPISVKRSTDLLHQLLAVPTAQEPELFLEITLLGCNLESVDARPSAETHTKHAVVTDAKVAEAIVINEKVIPGTKASEKNTKPPEPKIPMSNAVTDIWPSVLDTMKKRHNTLYSILRMAKPELTEDTLTLTFAFAFHKKKMNEDKSRLILQEVVTQITHKSVTIVCVVKKDSKPPLVSDSPIPQTVSKESADNTLSTISNIFGGAEVLE